MGKRREESIDGWGKHGLEGQNKSAQGIALGICLYVSVAPQGQKNEKQLPLPTAFCVGCYSFAPFGGVSMLHPLPPGVARSWHINAPFGA